MQTWDPQGHLVFLHHVLLLFDDVVLAGDDHLETEHFLRGDLLVVLEVVDEGVEAPHERTDERVQSDLEGCFLVVLLLSDELEVTLQLLDSLVRLLLGGLELINQLPDALELHFDDRLLEQGAGDLALQRSRVSL